MKKLLSILLSLVMLLSFMPSLSLTAGAASMSDADFFAKFNYAANPALSTVKSYVDSGDYQNAKAALLDYFKARKSNGGISGFGITESDAFYGMAVLPMRNILTGPYEYDMWQGEYTVTSSSFTEYEVDVTDRIASELNNGAVSFMLFAGDKQQYPVYVQSKETANPPRLVVTYDVGGEENTVIITADHDTYISSGNASSTYGRETKLVIKEDGTGSDSTGSDTRRAYINFPLSEVADSAIISARLVLSSAYSADCSTGDKDVLVINVGDTMWDENKITWGGTSGNIYSYQNAPYPTWAASAPNADSEYHNVTSRFWFGKPMAYEYLSYLEDPDLYNATHPYHETYPGEDFGPKLVELMNAFASQRNYGYPRTLETGERLNRWVDIIDAFLETDVFDARLDEFCNIISFMWGDCNYLAGLNIASDSPWWSNWRIVANAGFFKACEYLPEFASHQSWRDKVEHNVEYTFDLLYNNDYSFTEAGPSYAAWCAKLFGDCLRAADMSGNPMSAAFREKVKYAARNALESYYPNGFDTNIGDSNYVSNLNYFTRLNNVFGKSDKVINSYVSGSDKGAEYLTRYYHNSNSAYMRNSWVPDEAVYINFTNNPSDGHYHPDSNQVLMYAYGSPLLVDSGRYSYSSTNSIHDTLRTAQSHNTVEAVGVNMGAHSAASSANSLEYSNTNDSFDFAASTQKGYSGVSHTRNVFFARNGFSIVTDYVTGSTSRTYCQNWHFMPSSNAYVDGKNVKTDFFNAPDITVAPASALTSSVKDGYHSANYGLVAKSQYASIEKRGSTVKFDTLLYPERADEEIEAYAEDLAEDDTSKAAMKITVNGSDSYYYVKNTADSDGTFASFTTDAKMAYVSEDEYMIANGKTISDKIYSLSTIVSMGVKITGTTVEISGEKLIPSSDSDAVKLYAPNTAKVTLNGQPVPFKQEGDFIYAVASAVSESITGAVAKVYPDKDGFVASNSGNEGEKQTTIIQAARSWQNRNAYMAFDLSDFENKEITSAVLKMKVTENASAGNLHFYYLDYGTWTRNNLAFVQQAGAMPGHTSTSGGFTGYAYRWSGSASGVSAGNWLSLSSNLPSYLAANSNYKFTWAILSETGSVKCSALAASQADRPYLEITYNYTSSSQPDPTVTIKTYTDNVLKTTTSRSAQLGSVYLHEPQDIVTQDGTTYYLDGDLSNLSVVVSNDDNLIEVYYKSGNIVTVNFTDVFGNKIKPSEEITVSPYVTGYTYSPLDSLTSGEYMYEISPESSKLSCSGADGSVLTAVYKKTAEFIGDNLVSNGSFEDENGNFSVEGWLTAKNSSDTIGNPFATDHFYAVTHEYTVNNNSSSPLSTVIPDGDWALGTKWNDGPSSGNNLCSIIRYVPVTVGKTYLISYKVKHRTGAQGTYLKTSLVPENKTGNSTITEANTTNPGFIGSDWTTITRTFTATEETDNVMFYFRWLGDGGSTPYWFFDDFSVREISPVEYTKVTFDEKEIITEGTLPLGEETAQGYILPSNVMGYNIVSANGDSKFVPAGITTVQNGDIITTVNTNIKMITGAQIRIGDGLDEDGKISTGSGIRFIAQIDRSNVDDTLFTYGIEISAQGSSRVLDVPAQIYQDDDHSVFTAVATNLSVSNYNRPYTAKAYVNAVYSDNTSSRIYAPASVTRSIYQVSAGLLKNGSNGLSNCEDVYGPGENSALYGVLNAYVNMVGVRLTLTKDGSVSVRTEGTGSYTGDPFFSVESVEKSEGVYTVTITPLADYSYRVTFASYWMDFIRINNNNSTVKSSISNSQINEDGSITFDFTPPQA